MNESRWQQLSGLIDELFELDASERARRLGLLETGDADFPQRRNIRKQGKAAVADHGHAAFCGLAEGFVELLAEEHGEDAAALPVGNAVVAS